MLRTDGAARFWVYHRGDWVRLALRPGESREYSFGGRTDEGYFSESGRYSHTGDGILSEWCEWGRDCDGGYERSGESWCPLADLTAHDASECGLRSDLPAWRPVSRAQRDEFAELAGY